MDEHTQPTQQPQIITFKEIAYTQQKEINYLDDIAAMGNQYVSFLQSLNYNQTSKVERSAFNSIADDLYKKIVKQGYVDRPSKVVKKSKKGDAQVNFYNINDSFIDDQDCCIEKKQKVSSFEDYCCVPVTSIEELYSSPQYKKIRQELIVEEGKRKGEQFSLNQIQDKEKFDEIRKHIKNLILGIKTQPVVNENEAINIPIQVAPPADNSKVIQVVEEEQVAQSEQKKE